MSPIPESNDPTEDKSGRVSARGSEDASSDSASVTGKEKYSE